MSWKKGLSAPRPQKWGQAPRPYARQGARPHLFTDDSGQVMLIAVLFAVLLALCVPILMFLGQTGTKHQVGVQKRTAGINVAQQGISYAETILTAPTPPNTPTTWTKALAGNFPADCNNATPVTGPGGSQFFLKCFAPGAYPGLQNYQVAVIATAVDPTGGVASRGLLAFLSQATLAANMPNGQGVSFGLQTMNTPAPGHTVKFVLVNTATQVGTDVPGGSVTFPASGSAPVGSYTYAPLPTPITLTPPPPGFVYVLVSHESILPPSGGVPDQWYDCNTTLGTTGVASIPGVAWLPDDPPGLPWRLCDDYVQCPGLAGPCGGANLINHSYVPVDFQYNSGGITTNFVTATTLGTIRNSNPLTGWVGMQVQVPAGPGIQVTGLGHINVQGNGNAYTVEWGPIGNFDSHSPPTLWDMADNTNLGRPQGGVGIANPPLGPSFDINAGRFPRKFSGGGITGEGVPPPDLSRDPCCSTATAHASDQKEYWAFTSLGVPPAIDLGSAAGYLTLALDQENFTANNFLPTLKSNGNPLQPDSADGGTKCFIPVPSCGYFTVPTTGVCPTCVDTATFSGAAPGYQPPPRTGNIPIVIFVQGNAEFDDIDMILKYGTLAAPQTGAVVVTGNLTLGTKNNYDAGGGYGGAFVNMHHHNAFLYEYPYGNPWNTGSPPTATTGGFQGFLYVQGNLYVNNTNDNFIDNSLLHYWWVVDGAIRVDGQLIPMQHHNLFLVYDDQINRLINVQPLAVQIDMLTEVTGVSN